VENCTAFFLPYCSPVIGSASLRIDLAHYGKKKAVLLIIVDVLSFIRLHLFIIRRASIVFLNVIRPAEKKKIFQRPRSPENISFKHPKRVPSIGNVHSYFFVPIARPLLVPLRSVLIWLTAPKKKQWS